MKGLRLVVARFDPVPSFGIAEKHGLPTDAPENITGILEFTPSGNSV